MCTYTFAVSKSYNGKMCIAIVFFTTSEYLHRIYIVLRETRLIGTEFVPENIGDIHQVNV